MRYLFSFNFYLSQIKLPLITAASRQSFPPGGSLKRSYNKKAFPLPAENFTLQNFLRQKWEAFPYVKPSPRGLFSPNYRLKVVLAAWCRRTATNEGRSLFSQNYNFNAKMRCLFPDGFNTQEYISEYLRKRRENSF